MWSGLISDYYIPRWKSFVQTLTQCLMDKTPFDETKFQERVKEIELAWEEGTNHYPNKAIGDTIQISKSLFNKWV